MKVIVTTPEELKQIIHEFLQEELNNIQTPVLYSRNQIAHILKMGNGKVQRLIDLGKIGTTRDGKITSKELNNYLNNVGL